MAEAVKARKQAIVARSQEATRSRSTRRAGRVDAWVAPSRVRPAGSRRKPARGQVVELAPEFPQGRHPYPLSAPAQFMEMRPLCLSPIEWYRLFTPETDLWAFLVVVAEAEAAA